LRENDSAVLAPYTYRHDVGSGNSLECIFYHVMGQLIELNAETLEIPNGTQPFDAA
jgi:hypothetical protein